MLELCTGPKVTDFILAQEEPWQAASSLAFPDLTCIGARDHTGKNKKKFLPSGENQLSRHHANVQSLLI